MGSQEVTGLINSINSWSEETRVDKVVAVFTEAAVKGRIGYPEYRSLMGNLRVFQQFGIKPMGILLELSEMLRSTGIDDPDGKGLHESFYPYLPILAGDTPYTEILEKVDTLGVLLKGVLEYDSIWGSVTITPKGKALGVTTAGLYPYVGSLLEQHYPDLKSKAYSKPYLEAVLMETCRLYLTSLTPSQELKQKLELYQHRLGTLAAGDCAQHIDDCGPSFSKVQALVTEFATVYGIPDRQGVQALAKILTALAARTLTPGCSMQWAPVLVGSGGCGKTAFGSLLALDTAPAISVDAKVLDTRHMSPIIGASVVNFDEFDSITSKQDTSDFKSFITSTSFRLRQAYRKDPETVPASWVTICTTNSAELRDDGAEMRRYVRLSIPGGPAEGQKRWAWLNKNRALLQAAGLALHQAGFQHDLAASEILEYREGALSLVAEAEETHLLETSAPQLARLVTEGGTQYLGLTSKNIWSLFSSPGERWHTTKTAPIIKALKDQGWYMVGRKKFMLPPGLDPQIPIVPCHPDNLFKLRAVLASGVVQLEE